MSEKSESIKIFKCNICNKIYASASSLCNHNKKFHTAKSKLTVSVRSANSQSEVSVRSANSQSEVSILSVNNQLINSNSTTCINIKTYKCKYCNNIYKHKQSKFKHEQICTNKTNASILNEENNLLKQESSEQSSELSSCKKTVVFLQQELAEMKNQLAIFINKQAKVHPKTLQKLINNNTNIINNTMTNSNNTTNNITIKFGSENLTEVLNDKEMQFILSRCRKSIEESIMKKI